MVRPHPIGFFVSLRGQNGQEGSGNVSPAHEKFESKRPDNVSHDVKSRRFAHGLWDEGE